MSYKTMQEATKRGEEVRAMMTSIGWDLKVHKNHGLWHWSLKNGAIKLYESMYNGESDGFWTLMSREMGGVGGNPDWSLRDEPHHFRSEDPNEAVKAQVEAARAHLDILIESVLHGESLLQEEGKEGQ